MVDSRSPREEIRDILDRQAAAERDGASYLEKQELEFEKWRLVHRTIHRHPFPTRGRLPRSEQWREAANHVRDLGETELLDWALLQSEIARNLENGIQDMRPRKNGPCHPLVLEYVANRKRKALAVLHFAKASEDEGVFTVGSAHHARSRDILGEPASDETGSDGGHEGIPWERDED